MMKVVQNIKSIETLDFKDCKYILDYKYGWWWDITALPDIKLEKQEIWDMESEIDTKNSMFLVIKLKVDVSYNSDLNSSWENEVVYISLSDMLRRPTRVFVTTYKNTRTSHLMYILRDLIQHPITGMYLSGNSLFDFEI